MIIGIIALSLIVLILIYFLWARRGKNIIFAKISQGDLESNAKFLAIAMRMPDAVGASPKIKPLARSIRSAYRIIKRKVDTGDELYEFERWIYENYYSVIKLIDYRGYRNFAILPHKNKQSRILAVAELMVNASYGDVGKGVVQTVIDTFNTHTPLHIEEIDALEKAVIFELISKLAEISNKVAVYDKMKRNASQKGIKEKLTSSDCYLYWLKRSGQTLEHKGIIKTSDINIDNIEYSFSTTLIDNCIIVSNCIKSLKNLKNIFTKTTFLEYCYANSLLESDAIYASMDNESKRIYLLAVDKLAGLFNVSEKLIIDSAFALGRAHGEHFGRYLFENKVLIRAYLFSKKINKIKLHDTRKLQWLYIATLFTLNTLLAVALGLLTGSIWLGITVGILAGIAALPLTEFITQKAHKLIVTTRPSPKINYDEIPNQYRTMVVVPCFVGESSQIPEICANIKALRAVNNGKNISYSLLIDYKKASQAILADDFKWNSQFAKELENYCDINVFVRRRTLINGKYSGRERKRGALYDLNELLLTGDYHEFSYVMSKNIEKPELICVLDADSKLMPNALRDAICTMAHPLNNDYDLMTFANKYNMTSIDSIFSKQYYYDSGYEGYNGYSNYYFDAFDKAIFCGKGIYRLGNFYNKLSGALPQGKILSHDIIEGAILNTGGLKQSVYEDVPTNFVSECARNNRWLAGDIQLISVLGKKIKNAKGKREAVEKDPIYNNLIFTNFMKGIAPIAMLALVLLSLFTMKLAYSLPIIVLIGGKLVIELVDKISGINKGVRLKYVLLGMAQVLIKSVIDFLMLPFHAVNNIIVYLKSLWKMMFDHSGELQWKTFFEGQRGYKLSQYIMMLLPSFIVMMIIGVLGYGNLAPLAYIAFFYAIALCLYPLGASDNVEAVLSETQKNLLIMYARKTYNYFDLNRNDSGLICDNYQVKPYKGKSNGTSPTNLGFSLLAEVTASELKIIEPKKAEKNINKILKALISLKKYKGHLYNWYDIETKQILPPNYVSSVDSGNLIACLIVTKEFLNKNGLEGGELCLRLITAMDFGFLFDGAKGLFYIGYNTVTREYGGHYDLLASEAQILNYIMSAKGEYFTWDNLTRNFTSSRGNTLLSWSGTMFEYLMPSIFYKAPRHSMINYSCLAAIRTQRKHKCMGYFGISESGYYKFDDRLNYQYHAFGDNSLALRAESNRCVISPYSSFLAMMYNSGKSLDNLQGLYNENLFGEYGFYEAIDFTNGKNIISSYMAHHQGMIISSIANVLCGDVINKLFMSDDTMLGGNLLLTERRSINKTDKKPHEDYVYNNEYKFEELSAAYTPSMPPTVGMLTNGKYSVYVNSNGGGLSKYYDICIGKKRDKILEKSGLTVTCTDTKSGESFSPYCSDMKNIDNYRINYAFNAITLMNTDKCFKEVIYVPHCINGELREITIHNLSTEDKEYSINLYSDICLTDYESEIAHSTYNDLFVSTKLGEDKNSIIYHRKSKEKSGDCYAAIILLGIKSSSITSNRYNALGRLGKGGVDSQTDFGDVIFPCFGATININLAMQSSVTFEVVTIFSNDTVELGNMLTMCHENHFVEYAKKSAEIQALSRISGLIPDINAFKRAIKLGGDILYKPYEPSIIKHIGSIDCENLMAGIGLNYRNKTVYYEYVGRDNELKEAVGIMNYINSCGIDVNLIISYVDSDMYHRPIYNKIMELLGGVTSRVKLIERTELVEDVINCCYLRYENIDKSTNSYDFDCEKFIDTDVVSGIINIPLIAKSSGSGGFDTENNYIVTTMSLLPYSNVICMEHGGTIATENGGGYYYVENSRENKITYHANEPILDTPSEVLYIGLDSKYYRINKFIEGGYVKHGLGITSYNAKINDVEGSVSVYLVSEGNVKIYEVSIFNDRNVSADITISLGIEACLGAFPNCSYACAEQSGNVITCYRGDTNSSCYLSCIKEEIVLEYNNLTYKNTKNQVNYTVGIGNKIFATVSVELAANSRKVLYFTIAKRREDLSELNVPKLHEMKNNSIKYFENINKVKLSTENKSCDILMNNYLMYQVVSARLNGRCGYYQVGGAVGFRDQLQDCLAMLYVDPNYVREHIIDCAKRQFVEGDVLHWWHPENMGVRTKISDDKLFLPYVVSEYIRFTGDKSILSERVTFLSGAPLGAGQESRYQNYENSGHIDSIFNHCIAAINDALKFGEHDLLLIGSGDWNDALNGIGICGIGESVWLTMFCYSVISDFIEFLDSDVKMKYLKILDRLYSAINKQYVGGYYRRAYTDDGKWLGDSASSVCKIDLICQAYSVISKSCKVENANSAMKNAEETLVDYDKKIIKLLSPPFNKENYCGYISSYPEGVRENGGQYTHGAIWFIRALAMKGEREKALELINMINPINKCSDVKLNLEYMGEPYVLSGDVYTSGQMGWSWYTGSAAWLYKVVIEDIIGIRIIGSEMIIDPQYLKCFGEKYSVTIKWKCATYILNFELSNRRNISIDGITYGNSAKNSEKNAKSILKIPLIENTKTYNVRIEY